MSELERRYRRALRWYPRRWRAQHEEALLGILLDQAEEEGRMRMTSNDRHDLARQGLRRRLAPVPLALLGVVALLTVLLVVRMLLDGTGPDAQLFLVPPPLHRVPIGGGWTPPFILRFSGAALYLGCGVVAISAASGAALLARRMRR